MDSQPPETPTTPAPMPARRPRWRKFVIIAAVVLVAVPVAIRVAIGMILSPQAVVDRLEAQLNARVEIGRIDYQLFSSPARLVLSDVRLGERDDAADNAAKLGARPAMPKALLSAAELKLEGSLQALLSRKFDIQSLIVEKAAADIQVRKSGVLNINKLFREPAIVAGKPNPKRKAKAIVGTDTEGQGGLAPEDIPVVVDEMPFATRVKTLQFNGAQVQALIKKNGTLVDISDLKFEVSELDIDPADLAHHNKGKIRIHGMIAITKPGKKLDYAHLNLLGEGDIRPFEPTTKALNPLITARLTLQDPSEITLLPSLEKMNKKMETLKKVGINIGDKLGTSVQFAIPTTLDIEFRDSILRTLTPLHAKAQKIDIEIEPGAYVHTGTNDHYFRCILTGNQTLSDRMRSQITEKADIIPEGRAREEFLKELMDSFFKDGRFRPICVSRGELSDPEVEMENKLPDMGKFLRGVLEDFGLDPEVQKDLQESGTKLLEELLKKKDKGKDEDE